MGQCADDNNERQPLSTIDTNVLRETPVDEPPPSKKKKATKVSKRWTWDDGKVEALIANLIEYKSMKIYEGLDFEADLVTFYNDLRIMMAEMYPSEDFGPKSLELMETDRMLKEEVAVY